MDLVLIYINDVKKLLLLARFAKVSTPSRVITNDVDLLRYDLGVQLDIDRNFSLALFGLWGSSQSFFWLPIGKFYICPSNGLIKAINILNEGGVHRLDLIWQNRQLRVIQLAEPCLLLARFLFVFLVRTCLVNLRRELIIS